MSLLKQGGIEMEIIIVNDGSQDNTCKTAQSLAGRFSNVRLVNQKNTGQYHARIHGVREAKGEYIAFTDADDFIKNGFYSSVMAVMEKEDADILEFGMMKIKGRKIISRFSPQMQVYDSREAVRRQLQKDGTVYSNGNKIYRCSLFQKIQFDEKIRYHEEDKLLNVKVMSIARKVMSIPDIGYIYDTRDESTTTRALTYDYLNVVKCSRAVYRYIKENRPEMSRMAHIWHFVISALYRCRKSGGNRKESCAAGSGRSLNSCIKKSSRQAVGRYRSQRSAEECCFYFPFIRHLHSWDSG